MRLDLLCTLLYYVQFVISFAACNLFLRSSVMCRSMDGFGLVADKFCILLTREDTVANKLVKYHYDGIKAF